MGDCTGLFKPALPSNGIQNGLRTLGAKGLCRAEGLEFRVYGLGLRGGTLLPQVPNMRADFQDYNYMARIKRYLSIHTGCPLGSYTTQDQQVFSTAGFGSFGVEFGLGCALRGFRSWRWRLEP